MDKSHQKAITQFLRKRIRSDGYYHERSIVIPQKVPIPDLIIFSKNRVIAVEIVRLKKNISQTESFERKLKNYNRRTGYTELMMIFFFVEDNKIHFFGKGLRKIL